VDFNRVFVKKGWTSTEFSKKGVDFNREFEAKKPPLHLKGSSLRGTLQFANRERMPIGFPFFRAFGALALHRRRRCSFTGFDNPGRGDPLHPRLERKKF
jgi:hypothetical protein